MRWTVRVFAVIAVLWAAYFAWPYFSVRSLVQAVRTHDVETVRARVNVTALRRSLTEQIFRTYLRLTGRELKLGALRDLAVAATSSVADPIVAQLMSSDVLFDLLASGWPTAVLPDKLPGINGLRTGSLGNAWQVFANSDHGLRTFALMVPANAPPARQFRLQFRLSNATWRLTGIELPEELRVRLTQELIRLVDKK